LVQAALTGSIHPATGFFNDFRRQTWALVWKIFIFSPAADGLGVSKYCCMARGWESKDVESQVEAKQTIEGSDGKRKSADQIHREQERKGLQLSRTRVMHDLESATNPNHRKSLEAALAHLEKKLSELSDVH
jgi:hypothetical protein